MRPLCLAALWALASTTIAWSDDAAWARQPMPSASAGHPRWASATVHWRPGRSREAKRRSAGAASARRLLWSDEFRGAAGAGVDPARWNVIYGGGGFGNEELQYYTQQPANLALDGAGHLAVTARRGTFTGTDGITRAYTSGAIQSKGLFQTTYGQLDARIEIPQGRGLWPAFWAVGGDVDTAGWPQSGEIDMMENLGNDPFTIYGSIHGPQTGLPNGYGITTPKRSAVSLANGFHVYGVDWGPGKLVFTLDGAPYATYTPSSLTRSQQWVFDKPFFLILNLAVGGTWPGSPKPSTPFPARMLIDWVRVYS